MGGHGGLNILPQKKWNVYNWDNRDKVKEDENLVRGAIRRKKEEATAAALNAKVAALKGQEFKQEEEKEQNEELNEIFERQKEKRKREEKKAKKQVEKTFQREVSSSHHINLFQAEQMADQMKQKQKDSEKYDVAVKSKEERYSGTLGSLFVKEKPWYCQVREQTLQRMKNEKKIQDVEQQRYHKEGEVDEKMKKKDKKDKKREKKKREKDEKKRKKREKRQELQRLRRERLSREENELKRKQEVINL